MKYSYTLKEGRKGSKEGIGGMDKGKESVRGGTKGKGIDRRLTIDKEKNAPVSLATALAIRVFPVPGGPYRRIPRGGFTPIALNS